MLGVEELVERDDKDAPGKRFNHAADVPPALDQDSTMVLNAVS